MSYEPHIIIKKADLKKHEDKLDKYLYDFDCDKQSEVVMHFLALTLRKESFKIDNIEMILCQPELSAFSKAVRKKLRALDVQYTITD